MNRLRSSDPHASTRVQRAVSRVYIMVVTSVMSRIYAELCPCDGPESGVDTGPSAISEFGNFGSWVGGKQVFSRRGFSNSPTRSVHLARHSTPPSRTTPRTDFLVRALLSVRSRASPRRKHALHDRRVMHAGLGVHLRPDASLVVWPRSPSLRLESSTMPVSGIEELQGAGGPQCAQSITAHAAAIERQFRCG